MREIAGYFAETFAKALSTELPTDQGSNWESATYKQVGHLCAGVPLGHPCTNLKGGEAGLECIYFSGIHLGELWGEGYVSSLLRSSYIYYVVNEWEVIGADWDGAVYVVKPGLVMWAFPGWFWQGQGGPAGSDISK